MARYIDADDFKKEIMECNADPINEFDLGWDTWGIFNAIDRTPTADVQPVMHAHWTDDGECSNCGGYQLFEKAADRYMYWRSTSAFCPLCGAIMDEEVNDGKSSEV